MVIIISVWLREALYKTSFENWPLFSSKQPLLSASQFFISELFVVVPDKAKDNNNSGIRIFFEKLWQENKLRQIVGIILVKMLLQYTTVL